MKKIKVEIDGYQTVHSFDNGDGWRIGLISPAERFTEEGMTYLERHNMTDEVFILLQGNATLIIGEEKTYVPMETGILYNVEQSEWHHVLIEKDSIVAVVENKGTSKENTEYMEL